MTDAQSHLVASATVPVDHGLIIIEDSNGKYGHDEWDPATDFVSVGSDSVYLSVRSSVDGPVEVTVVKSEVRSDELRTVYFDGVIQVPTRLALVHDADDVVKISMRCAMGESRVRVMVDRPGLAARMLVMFLPS
jgi:hypothetical protein